MHNDPFSLSGEQVKQIQALCASMRLEFNPPWYLQHAFLQSIFANLRFTKPNPNWQLHECPLDDGDFHEVALLGDEKAPLLLMIPGMAGSWRSALFNSATDFFLKQGWQLAVLNHRGFGEKINHYARNTHAGAYKDIAEGVDKICQMRPNVPLYALGVSLGANQLLHYLAKIKPQQIKAAVAISTPFDLSIAAKQTPAFYQRYILITMRQHYLQKIQHGIALPISKQEVKRLRTFRNLDASMTAPLHDFPSVDDYYQQASAMGVLKDVNTPTLLLSARDDPFFPGKYLPTASDCAERMWLLDLQKGGHMGFWSLSDEGKLIPFWAYCADQFFNLLA